ncbi:MAG: hypothetical protein RLZZ381_205 [Cyanobacteriota bacterium]|jgi:inorganic phosphate transporter, PiT family
MWTLAIFFATVFLAYANGANDKLNFAALGKSFFIPLLVSPLLAIALAIGIYALLHYGRTGLGIEKAWCVCVGGKQELVPVGNERLFNQTSEIAVDVAIDTMENCNQQYVGNFWGINSQKLVDGCHFLSAGAVGFANRDV